MGVDVTELCQLAVGTADPVDKALHFQNFDMGLSRTIRDCNGTRGTFFLDSNRIRESARVCTPTYSGEPTASEWATWLEWIMGGTPSGSGTVTYPFSNTPASKYLYFAPNAGTQFFGTSVAVDNATLSANAGEPLTLAADMVGISVDDTRTNFPTLSYDTTNQPYMLSDLSLTFSGSTRQPRSISLGISNGIDRNRFFASLTLNTLVKLSARFTLTLEVPSGDNAALYRAGVTASVAATATFTNPVSSAVMVWSMPAIRFPARSPQFQQSRDGWVSIQGICCRSGATAPVTITNTP